MDDPEQTAEEPAEIERARAMGRSWAQEISAHIGNRPVYIAADGEVMFVGANMEPGKAVEAGEDENQLAESSQSGKNAKKNRKEKERRARKKRQQNANVVSPEPDLQGSQEDVGEHGDDGDDADDAEYRGAVEDLDVLAHPDDVLQEPADV